MNRYSAQKQYWKAKQTKQDKEKIADVVLLQKLQVCARVCRAVGRMGLGHMVRRHKGLTGARQWVYDRASTPQGQWGLHA